MAFATAALWPLTADDDFRFTDIAGVFYGEFPRGYAAQIISAGNFAGVAY
jgi:hypothetical protein